MKKTVSINLVGMNFLIEEDAYELLQSYISRLEKSLHNQQGSKDIIEDIELRIAELCSARLNDRKQVIDANDIEEILSTLGNPEDYIEDEDQESASNFEATSKDRRLFRDEQNGMIGGVCSGLANYFNMDVVIIRAIFVLILFFGGFGIPLYIVLWIIVPRANSTIDRLRMKGRPITVESVKDEVEAAAQRVAKGSRKMATKFQSEDAYQKRFASIGKFFRVAFGLGFLTVGLTLLITLLVFVVGGLEFIPAQTEDGFLSLADFGSLILQTDGDYFQIWTGGLLVSGSVILFLFLIAFTLLFNIRNKWTKLSLLGLVLIGIVGFVLCLQIGIRTSKEMAIENRIPYEIGSYDGDILKVKVASENEQLEHLNLNTSNDFGILTLKDNAIYHYGVSIKYQESHDSLFHITKVYSARAINKEKAHEKASRILYESRLEGNQLILASDYHFPKKDKIRNQEVEIIIEIPKHGSVEIDNHTIKLDQIIEHEDIDYQEGYIDDDGKYRHWD